MIKLKDLLRSYILMVIGTLCLYIWQLHLHPMINPSDGVTYLQAAAAYANGGFQAILSIGDQAKWPFYPLLIGWIHVLTQVDVWTVERIIDGLFISISSCIFLHVVCDFSSHRNTAIWGVLLWLSWHGYVKWWPQVLRDHGFLLCLMISFYCYYRFISTQKFSWAVAWFSSLFVAELFRIEAVVYLLAVPISVFFIKHISKMQQLFLWLKLNAFTLLMALIIIALFSMRFLSIHDFRFAYIWQEISQYFFTTHYEFMQRYYVMQKSIFYRENSYQAYALIIGYLVMFFCHIIGQVGFLGLFSLLFLQRALAKINKSMLYPVFFIYIILASILPILFFLEYAFLNERYLLPFGLFVLLILASALPNIIDSFQGIKKIIFIFFIILLFFINAMANILHLGHKTQDYLDVGLWLKEHYPQQSIFTDTKKILFYASNPPDYRHGIAHEMWLHNLLGVGAIWLRDHKDWCQFDLLVLSAPPGKTAQEHALFTRLQREGAITGVVKVFKRRSNGEDILIAPILRSGCEAYVDARKIVK